jgi:hypothetical protein
MRVGRFSLMFVIGSWSADRTVTSDSHGGNCEIGVLTFYVRIYNKGTLRLSVTEAISSRVVKDTFGEIGSFPRLV